jgi:hypothetical protein
MICTLCSKSVETKTDRLPKGWKRDEGQVQCNVCWGRRMVVRAITLPVAEIMDGTWEEFRKALRESWGATTQAANWMMTELYARDVRRGEEPKMPPMPKIYLYPEARRRFPALASQTVAALENALKAKYRAVRYEIIWTCGRSLPTHRYPHPLPLPNQSWSIAAEEPLGAIPERPRVSVRIGDRRWTLRLRGGPRYRRQLAAVRDLITGGATPGQLDLYEQSIDGKKHVMCKMAGWFLRRPRKTNEGTLFVRSTDTSLLVALNAKEENLWYYHADHLPRWSHEHREQLQRWSDDSKFEQRPVPSFTERRTAASAKYHQRMASAAREIAASLVGYAGRRKFARIEYNDSDQSFCAGFPWFALRNRVAILCDEAGIEFVVASGEAKTETGEPLAKKEI